MGSKSTRHKKKQHKKKARPHRARGTTWNGLLLVGASVLMLFTVDIFIRARYTIPGKGYGVFAAYPGSTLDLVISPDNVRTTHRYNLYGFRGETFSIERGKDLRIVCVGDSYTEGVGVAEEEAWPSALSRELKHVDPEVVNLGDGGTNPKGYVDVVTRVALLVHPTDIIVCMIPTDLVFGPRREPGPRRPREVVYPSDFDDPFRDNRKPWVRPVVNIFPGWVYLLDRARGRWPAQGGMYFNAYTADFTRAAVEDFHSWNSQIGAFPIERARTVVERRMESLAEGVLDAAKKGELNPNAVQAALSEPYFTHYSTTDDTTQPSDRLALYTEGWVGWFASLCRAKGVRPWFLNFPSAPLVADGPWGPLRDDLYEEAPPVMGDKSVRDIFRNACEKVNLAFIDATDILESHGDEELYLRYDTHPTAKTHSLVASLVADRMRSTLEKASRR